MLGLFTTKAYSEPASQTPLLHRKLRQILRSEDLIEGSHDYKAVGLAVRLVPEGRAVRRLDRRPARRGRRAARAAGRAGAAARPPRPRHAQRLADRRAAALALRRRAAGAPARRCSASASRPTRSTHHLVLGEGDRVQVHFRVHASGGLPDLDFRELEREVVAATRTWDDELRDALVARHGEPQGRALATEWGARFPRYYKASTDRRRSPSTTSAASRACETLGEPFVVGLQNEPDESGERTRVGLYKSGGKVELSAAMPMLEDLGLRVIEEVPTRLAGGDGDTWVQDFGVLGPGDKPIDLEAHGARVADCISAVWRGDTESDPLNRLVLAAGLDWRQIEILRAYRKYRQRIGSRFTESYQNDTLVENAALTANLVRAVRAALRPRARARRGGREGDARGDPGRARQGRVARPRPHPAQPARADRGDAAHQRLPARARRDELQAALRRRAGHPRARAADGDLRLLGRHGGDPPARRADRARRHPLVGPHGLPHRGLRPDAGAADQERPDRPGGRQGRLLPQAPARRTRASCARRSSASTSPTCARCSTSPTTSSTARSSTRPTRACSTATTPTSWSPPTRARRRSRTPPTRSPEDYGFWLGDAFASGGSSGYDHKKLGITAPRRVGVGQAALPRARARRRARTRSRSSGSATCRATCSATGCCSPTASGWSPPTTTATSSSTPTRTRTSASRSASGCSASPARPGTTTTAPKISEGGGVWPRTAKWIPLSESAQRALGVEDDSIAPNDLIRDILRAPVDLLWNGGIGTVVKASDETDEAAQDRSSDAIRVDASELRCRVVGEGGNLGLTRRARVEFARGGGRINADFIDNSAGVDCSDHEVNLKVLLGLAERAGELTRPDRDALLRDVDRRGRRARALRLVPAGADHRPGDAALRLAARRLRGPDGRARGGRAARPRLGGAALGRGAGRAAPRGARHGAAGAVAAADLREAAGEAARCWSPTLLDDPWLQRDLRGYFPQPVVERFGDAAGASIRCGASCSPRSTPTSPSTRSGRCSSPSSSPSAAPGPAEVVSAYRIAREVVGAEADWEAIEELEGRSSPRCRPS